MSTELAGKPSVDTPPEGAALYTIAQAAVVLSVKKTTIRKWIMYGQIKVYRMGRCVRLSKRDVDAFINDGKTLVRPIGQSKRGPNGCSKTSVLQ